MTHQTYDKSSRPIDPLQWLADAACAAPGIDPALFFEPEVESARGRRLREARAFAVCRHCPVVDDCLDYAQSEGVIGVWGGTTLEVRVKRARIAKRLLSA